MPATGAFFYKYVLERLKCQYLFCVHLGKKYDIQGTSPFKVVFQGFSRHLQIQGSFKAFQVVVPYIYLCKIISEKVAVPDTFIYAVKLTTVS